MPRDNLHASVVYELRGRVMTDEEIRTRIADGMRILTDLARWRRARISLAEHYIASVNKQFDKHSVAVQREITKLEKQLTPEPDPTPAVPRAPRKPRTVSLAGTEDWTPEEREHFVALVTGNK